MPKNKKRNAPHRGGGGGGGSGAATSAATAGEGRPRAECRQGGRLAGWEAPAWGAAGFVVRSWCRPPAAA